MDLLQYLSCLGLGKVGMGFNRAVQPSVQEGSGAEDGWMHSFCNMQFLSGHGSSDIDHRAFYVLMTSLHKVEKIAQAVLE